MGNILEAAIPTEEERDRTLRPFVFLAWGCLSLGFVALIFLISIAANQTCFVVPRLPECATGTSGCSCCWRHLLRV